MVVVQPAEGLVQIHLLLGKDSQFSDIAAALGLGDERPQVALAVVEGALLDFLQGSLDFGEFGRLDFGQQGLGEESALGFVCDHFHGVAGLAIGQRLQRAKCAKMLKPSWLLG